MTDAFSTVAIGVSGTVLAMIGFGLVSAFSANRAEARRWRAEAARHGWESEEPWRLNGSTAFGQWEFRGFFEEDTGAADLLWRRLESPPSVDVLVARVTHALTSNDRGGPVTYTIRRGAQPDAGAPLPPFALPGWDAQWRAEADRLAQLGLGGDIQLRLTGPMLVLSARGGRPDMTFDLVAQFVKLGLATNSQLEGGWWARPDAGGTSPDCATTTSNQGPRS